MGSDEQGVERTCRLVATSAMSTCGSSEPEAMKAESCAKDTVRTWAG
jgi:hypothetical protein